MISLHVSLLLRGPTRHCTTFYTSARLDLSSLVHSFQVLSNGLWLEAIPLHVGANLFGHLLEDLLSEVSSLHALVEAHELDDVTCGGHSS